MRNTRDGMTLVELLVVITIIGILGGIVALVAPRFQEQSRVAEGARQFTNWLQIARQRAQRDRAPRGLRLVEYLTSSTAGVQEFYYKFIYVEQPEDITGVAGMVAIPPNVPRSDLDIQPNLNVYTAPPSTYAPQLQPIRSNYQQVVKAALTSGAADMSFTASQRAKFAQYATVIDPTTNPTGWRYLIPLGGRQLAGIVGDGDIVEFAGARYNIIYKPIPVPVNGQTDCVLVIHRARDEYRDYVTTGPPMWSLIRNTITSPLGAYRITRATRPIAGEPELTLPANVAVDFIYPTTTNPGTRTWPAVPQGSPAGTGYFDIVFSPSGEVISGASGRVIFWLRDVTLDSAAPVPAGQMPPGENRLVVLHARNGQVTAHPVNPTVGPNNSLTDPYSFVRDGKSSAAEDE